MCQGIKTISRNSHVFSYFYCHDAFLGAFLPPYFSFSCFRFSRFSVAFLLAFLSLFFLLSCRLFLGFISAFFLSIFHPAFLMNFNRLSYDILVINFLIILPAFCLVFLLIFVSPSFSSSCCFSHVFIIFPLDFLLHLFLTSCHSSRLLVAFLLASFHLVVIFPPSFLLFSSPYCHFPACLLVAFLFALFLLSFLSFLVLLLRFVSSSCHLQYSPSCRLAFYSPFSCLIFHTYFPTFPFGLLLLSFLFPFSLPYLSCLIFAFLLVL